MINSFAETTFLLIRHAETEWNELGKVQGQQDIPLNNKGLLQAEKLAHVMSEHHPDIAHIYSSDLSRAAITAEILSQKLKFTFSTSQMLREICRGQAEGLTRKQSDEMYGDLWEAKIPGAETKEDAVKRMKSFLQSIGKAHEKKKVAIVTHGMLMRILISEIQGYKDTRSLPNCVVVKVLYAPENRDQPFQVVDILDLTNH